MTTSFSFATKAATLERLTPHITQGRLCDQMIVRAPAWTADRAAILDEIAGRFGKVSLVVRSSAATEDGWDNSLAGAHLSVVDVAPLAPEIADAIDRVFASYRQTSSNDEVLVQPIVRNVLLSGVVLTRDLDTGGPYYVINYDDLTGRTDTVTGGGESKTVLVHRTRPEALRSSRLRKLIDCVIELETITGTGNLDVEFCIDEAEDVYILQVRPLAAQQKWISLSDQAVDAAIDHIRKEITQAVEPAADLSGRTTILGEMTDWNPAEMIGTTPHPLALSLYKSLITDRVWAEARALMGYRSVSDPLLVDFYGRPYIDIRRSLNSFLPANIDEGIAQRLIDHQLSCLAENPELHDKVEFDIAVTCKDFSFDQARGRLTDAGLNGEEIEELSAALGGLTGDLLEAGDGGISVLTEKTDRLLKARPEIDGLPPLERVHRLLNDCRSLGTLPFSQLARHGFIGILFLKSLVRRGVFGQDDMDNFMYAIHTVATELVHDMHRVVTGDMPERDFLTRYGHLRPGTYDILSWRYDERPDLFLGHTGRELSPSGENFALSGGQKTEIETLLAEQGYSLTAEQLLSYITHAVKAREQAKFAFSRTLSDALKALGEWGEETGFSRDDLSYLPIETISADKDLGSLRERVEKEREGFTLTRAIRLPHLITEPSDIDIVRMPLGHPTFITGKSVTAPARPLSAGDVPDIDGSIVLIESADPGFDWIFSYDIRGLITMYGGANSHMAIRCAEFGLPAAIGCGERLFETLAKAPVVELNCAARKVSGH
ncbi:MAG: pyruvate phosphate dikinase [Rhodospirillaceae bacterium]|nr:pyruvate phosphate dikinase [Rhodospirillaceae bacterium]|tara:strand:- start:971 stop:3292 length:2322 start_codon:yes stop_codon:yes gene_type:complete